MTASRRNPTSHHTKQLPPDLSNPAPHLDLGSPSPRHPADCGASRLSRGNTSSRGIPTSRGNPEAFPNPLQHLANKPSLTIGATWLTAGVGDSSPWLTAITRGMSWRLIIPCRLQVPNPGWHRSLTNSEAVFPIVVTIQWLIGLK